MNGFKKHLRFVGCQSSKTVESYVKGCNTFFAWLEEQNMTIKEVRYQDMLAYMGHMEKQHLSTQYLNFHVRAVRHYFDYLMLEGKRKDNPASGLYRKGKRKRVVQDTHKPSELEKFYTKYTRNDLTGKRNKVMIGLMVFQGVTTHELSLLRCNDINLDQREVNVPGSTRSNERKLKLDARQVSLLREYIDEVRPQLLKMRRKKSGALILTPGKSSRINNALAELGKELRKQFPHFKSWKHFRSSVIAKLLEEEDVLEVMYKVGHRYVSSTEKYDLNYLNKLKEELDVFHPLN